MHKLFLYIFLVRIDIHHLTTQFRVCHSFKKTMHHIMISLLKCDMSGFYYILRHFLCNEIFASNEICTQFSCIVTICVIDEKHDAVDNDDAVYAAFEI